MSEVVVRSAHLTELAECRALRHHVFVVGQGVPEAIEADGRDAEFQHAIARHPDGACIGTARWRPDGDVVVVQRVAVHERARGMGIGARLMQLIEQLSALQGCSRVTLHAQASVIGFYDRLGYVGVGDRFWEAGIEHWTMSKALR